MASKKSSAIFIVLFIQLLTKFCNSFPLSTNSRWVVDQTGSRVKLACVSWVSHLQPMIPEGLEKKPVKFIASQIASTGFNCVRFTWATFMFTRDDYGNLTISKSLDKYNLKNAKAGIAKNNPQFLEMSVMEVHKAVVDELGKSNLMVVLDNHISQPGWCCSENDGNGFFGDPRFDPDEWLLGLRVVARRYKDNSAVIGMSLRNELRGSRQNEADWYKYMENGALIIHTESPNFLVIVSGLYYDTMLSFLKKQQFGVNISNKLVFEAHWYSFGVPTDKWISQSNKLCASETQSAYNNYLFLINGNNSFPLILSEFGIDIRGFNEGDNRFINCVLAVLAENDIDWALWTFQGSYILREGKVDQDEVYGVMDFNWDQPRNTTFLDRLQLIRQLNQDPKSTYSTSYIMYHPFSGQCAQSGEETISLGSCTTAARFTSLPHNSPIDLMGPTPLCLRVKSDDVEVTHSSNCSSNWNFVSSSGLQLAAQDEQGNRLCLEKNVDDSKLLTRKCLCVGDDLKDLLSCDQNPEMQWFKFVPVNVCNT